MSRPPGLLESRAAIADLVHAYARNILRRDSAACAGLLCDDVEFIVRELDLRVRGEPTVRSHAVGREQTLAYIARSGESMALCPLIHNLLIEINGCEARSTCVMENRTFPPRPGLIGEYEDSFRFDDRWRFAKRVYTLFVERGPTPAA